MAALRLAFVALALAAAIPARADPVTSWRPFVAEASARFGVPIAWIERVIRAESGGRTTRNGHPITSSAGAMGLMQLMPDTWAAMRARLGLGADPHDPRDNILAGTLYLRLMYDRFGYPSLFAAYNAGPGRYADHLERGRPLPDETQAYLVKVAGTAKASPSSAPTVQQSPPALFFTLSATSPKASTDDLFVTLSHGMRPPPRPHPNSRAEAPQSEVQRGKFAQSFQGYRAGSDRLKDDGAPPFFTRSLRSFP
ncbi:lytic transglycosylase domain-containing protein [Allosphingosinicella humi]